MSLLTQDRPKQARPPTRAKRASSLRFGLGRWAVAAAGGVAVVFSMLSWGVLLADGWWLGRTVVVVAAIGIVGSTARVLRAPAPLIPLVQFGALLVVLTQLFARSEALWGVVPASAAVRRLRELAADGSDYAAATAAPAGPNEGLLLLIVAGVGLVALAVDTLAAGLDLPGMTLIPLAALFLMPWLITGTQASGWALAGVAFAWLGILWALQSDRAARWSPGARPGSPAAGLAIAAGATSLAVLAGGLATLRGPADSVDVGTGANSGPLQLDEMVSLRRSLVNNSSNTIVSYTTSAEEPDYLRLAILDVFGGERWRASGPNRFAPTPPPPPDGTERVTYQLDIGPLGGSTVPSPSGTYLSFNGPALRWDRRTSLPRVVRGTVQDTSIGLLAGVQDLSAADLRASSQIETTSTSVSPTTRTDPSPLTGPELPRLAATITAEADNPFDQAVALQNWFVSEGGFTYSTAIDGGSDADALDAFLDERVGYCEQFAATMALMARTLGIPARVAIGFTPGGQEDDIWVIRGTDAHAWPELWLGAAGWVRFEPTPGATNASVPRYTGEDPDGETPQEDLTDDGAELPDESVEDPREADLAGDGAADSAGDQEGLRLLPVLAVLGLVVMLLPAGVRVVRRRRRARRGDDQATYEEIVDTVVDLDLEQEAATPRATLAAVARLLDETTDPDLAALAALRRTQRAVEWERYGDTSRPSPDAAPAPRRARGEGATATRRPPADPRSATPASDMATVRRALRRRAGLWRGVAADIVPRSVLLPLLRRSPPDLRSPGR